MKKISALFFCLVLTAGFFVYYPKAASAQLNSTFAITVKDFPRLASELKGTALEKTKQTILHAMTVTLANSARSLLNQIAFETASYIGAGGKGQKPVYFTEEFSKWKDKQLNNIGGQFIEALGQSNTTHDFIDKFGVCSPDFSVQAKMALGLVDYSSAAQGLSESRCNLAKIYTAGQDALGGLKSQIALWKEPGYLGNLANSAFDPVTTDVGISMLQFGKIDMKKAVEGAGVTLNRQEGAGWLNTDLFTGKITTHPGNSALRINSAQELMNGSFLKTTGDLLVDASNIFLNQLALKSFQRLMGELTKKSSSSSTAASDYYSQGNTGGVTEVERRNSTILQAKFNERSDYNVLGQLTACSDENNAGPTNCVITQPFAQAINDHLTVAEAIDKGLLDGNARVGYKANGDDLSFKEGYPYRSLIILRKYRVLPVGWEMAAEYIKAHHDDTQTMNLKKLVDCFADTTHEECGPFVGLIDPHWVLKLPQMFCGMEGYGSQLLTANVFQNPQADSPTTTANVNVAHSEGYCADEQSCIKEAPNGTCLQYGYCTQEKRQWIFSATDNNSCEPRNNTCQTFIKDSGDTLSYLENTLDYSDCDASQVGCKRYASVADAYNKDTDTISWNKTAGQLHFNKEISQCQANGEGCHEFIRFADSSANLLADGSFEHSSCVKDPVIPNDGDAGPGAGNGSSLGGCQLATIAAPGGYLPAPNSHWYLRAGDSLKAGIVTDKANSGTQSLYIEGDGGLHSKDNGISLLPAGFSMEDDTYYTLQASIYVAAGTVRLGFGDGTTGLSQETSTTGSWVPYSVKFYNPAGSTVHDIFIEGTDGSARFYVDSVQLSKGSGGSGYNEYGESDVIYEKLLPAYLEAACYVGGVNGGSGIDSGSGDGQFQLKPDAPQACFKYARKCSAEEVGCQAYTAASGVTITAKAKAKDACPTSCVGYDTFVQQPNFFDVKRAAYFIPSTARSCSAQAVGCTAFTNLDALDKGGEAVEYYSQLRRCIKPDASQCGQFYTWEGSDESGYQIHVFSLNQVLNGSSQEPKSTLSAAEESLVCNEAVYQKQPGEIGYNFDCRQFYAQDGSVSYHLLANTISCSDDCHPYRREATQAECALGKGDWDGSRCIYNVIPSEGTRCAAADAGCQEYTGNVANNTETLFTDTFEFSSTPTDNWLGGESSNTALNPGGRSLAVRGRPITKVLGDQVERDTSYNISFLAKAAGAATSITGLKFQNKDNQAADFSVDAQPLKTDWQLYSFNLSSLDHEVTPVDGTAGERLVIEFSGQVYIDNIKLTAVPNRYYLIKDSWTTPSECDQDFTGAPAAGYMLGCSQYQKADRSTVALRSFSSLCQDSAAGCEAMIDTKNSSGSAAAGKTFYHDTNNNGACDANEPDCLQKTAADSIINVVYDPAKLCGGADKGCQRLAAVSTYADDPPVFKDVYLRNNPDAYDTTVCKANAVGCSQWTSGGGGAVFFKDPGEQACEWKLKPGSNSDYGWFKKGKDTACDVTYDKTIGLGGAGSGVPQPKNWAGICAAEQAGCSEYIDPLSKFNDNIILNPTYQKSSGRQDGADFWTAKSATEATQRVSLTPQTLYVLKDSTSASNPTRLKIACDQAIQVLQEDNSFVQKTEIPYGSGSSASYQFYIPLGATGYDPVGCTVTRRHDPLNDPSYYGKDIVYLRQAVTAYQLRQNLDRTSHNNLVNFDKGSILFNERVQSGVKKAPLTFNADGTYETGVDGASPVTDGPHNANVLLKVQPDRVCSQWLDCVTYIPDPANPNKKICLDIGECQSLAADGSCAVRVTPERRNQTNTSTPFANLTGYSKVGYNGVTVNDYYQLSAMSQVGSQVPIADGGFESIDALSTEPGGAWSVNNSSEVQRLAGPAQVATASLQPLVKVGQPKDARFLAPEGLNILALSKDGVLTSKAYPFQPNARYVLSFYSYSQGGKLDVKIVAPNSVGSDSGVVSNSIPADDQPQQWVRRTIGFQAGSSSLRFVFSADGKVFLDDVAIEVSLNNSSNPTNSQPRYIAPSCRLYPTDSALACSVKDENDITTQGVKGYCLESDPRNPGVCLLWYPVDRISGDAAEEGAEIKFGNDHVYYCTEAKNECVAPQGSSEPTVPQVYCNNFVEVDTAKYWSGRLLGNTNPTGIPQGTAFPKDPFFNDSPFKINLGGDRGSVSFDAITPRAKEGFFGSLLLTNILSGVSGKQLVSINTTSNPVALNSFIPYYGNIDPNKRCPDNQKYYFTNNHDYHIPASTGNKYYGVVLPEDEEWSQSLGEWDMCGATSSVSAELNNGICNNHGTCNFGSIADIAEQTDCSENASECKAPVVDDPDTRCSVSRDGHSWTGKTENLNDGNKESLCVFYCYNKINEVTVAKQDKPLDIIRRLFPQTPNWQIYQWNQGTNSYSTVSAPAINPVMPECPSGGRPAVNGTTHADYCYIKPLIFNYAIDGATGGSITINNRAYKTFSFETKTDAEQLPIRSIVVNFGYKVGPGDNDWAIYPFSGTNFADRLRSTTVLYDFGQIDPEYNYLKHGAECNGASDCYLANPSITITDNWGISRTIGGIRLIIKK